MIKQHILFVDDERDLGELYAAFFEFHGYSFTVAESAKEAITILKNEAKQIQLIISDYQMPGGNGDLIAEYLNSAEYAPEMFFFSGYSSKDIEEQGGTHGRKLLRKPISPKVLLQKVKEYLNPGQKV